MSRFRNLVLSDPLPESGVRLLTLYSPALKRRADISLYLPESASEVRLPLLILLHGVYGSHWNWWALGDVPNIVRQMIASGEIGPLAIAMPSDGLWGDGSGYVPHKEFDAESWIVDDVPNAVAELFPHIAAERFFLAGLSMGGYGALRLGAKFADRVLGVSAHSAVTQIEDLREFVQEPMSDFAASGSENLKILHWMKQHRSTLPPIRIDCGADDSLLAQNRTLHADLEAENIPHAYEEYPGGHTWEYWRAHVRETLRFVARIVRRRSPK